MTGDKAGHNDLAKWLRRHREARGWTRPHTARLLIDAAHRQGDTQIPDRDSMCHNIYRCPLCQTTVTHGTYESF